MKHTGKPKSILYMYIGEGKTRDTGTILSKGSYVVPPLFHISTMRDHYLRNNVYPSIDSTFISLRTHKI